MFSSFINYKEAKRLFRLQHRVCAENHLLELNAEIDQAAEVDSRFFWKKVNHRRQQSQTHAGSEIRFDNRVCRDPVGDFILRNCTQKAIPHILTLFLRTV